MPVIANAVPRPPVECGPEPIVRSSAKRFAARRCAGCVLMLLAVSLAPDAEAPSPKRCTAKPRPRVHWAGRKKRFTQSR
jgi:hypothetical protein